MNSTDAALKKLFLKEILPLAERFHSEGKEFFLTKPKPGAETYYKKRGETKAVIEEIGVTEDRANNDFEKKLVDMWTEQGYPELAVLAPKLSKLAKSLRLVTKQEEEVSSFIYVMF